MTRHPKAGTQPARLLAYLREHPGSSSLEITLALSLVNVTGRVSDLRSFGYIVACEKVDGVDRYRVVEQDEQLDIGLSA